MLLVIIRDAFKPDFFQNPGFGSNPGSGMNYSSNSRFLWTLDSKGLILEIIVGKYIQIFRCQYSLFVGLLRQR